MEPKGTVGRDHLPRCTRQECAPAAGKRQIGGNYNCRTGPALWQSSPTTGREKAGCAAYTALGAACFRRCHSALEKMRGATSISRGSIWNTDTGPHFVPRRVRWPRRFNSSATRQ